MKLLIVVMGLMLHGIALAQSNRDGSANLDYSYAELRFVDVDTAGGDGLRLLGSYDLDNNWLIVGGA